MTVNRLLILVTVATITALVGPPARAQTQPEIAVYASDAGGTWQGTKTFLLGTNPVFDLYIDKLGTEAPTLKCDEAATGDQICGYDVLIEVQGDDGAFISGFVAESPSKMAFYPDPASNTRQLRVNLVDVDPPDANPILIGELSVNATDATGPVQVLVTGEGAVLANLELAQIPDQTIAVPEPAEILLLASGIAGLALLYRLRKGSLSAG